MLLRCIAPVRNGRGAWKPGDSLDLPEDEAGWYLRDAPGAWQVEGAADALLQAEEQAATHRTETATGLTAPDRMMSGGRKRKVGT